MGSETLTSEARLRRPRAESAGDPDPHLFVVFHAVEPLARGARHSLRGVDAVMIGRGEAHSANRKRAGGKTILDLRIRAKSMSSEHARLERGANGWELIDLGSKNGTFKDGVQVARARAGDGELLEMGRTFSILREALPTPEETLPDELPHHLLEQPVGLRTLLPDLAARLDGLRRIARGDVPVLLRGPTGSGKEVVARAIHRESRRAGPFVAVNCGALPAALVESLLFGHKKGAFSGAAGDELGFVRAAEGGTLLLDEIAELPLPAQAALLRVLQERQVVPVGAVRPEPVDVRIVSATHRPLETLIGQGAFRQDLLARLRGFTFPVPPLAERREDLGVLVADLLEAIAPGNAAAIRFDADAARALLRHPWPLNVRELEQCLRAALLLAGDGPITPAVLGDLERPSAPAARPSLKLSDADRTLQETLAAQLTTNRGNVANVARAMGKAPFQIHRWMKRLGLDPSDFRSR